MTCKCESSSATEPVFLTANPVDIQSPALGSAGPLAMAISSGCKISTSGRIDVDNFPDLVALKVWAQVGSGAEKEGTCSGGVTWSVSDVEGAQWSYSGLLQTITVRVRCLDKSTLSLVDVSNSREFIGNSGDYECQQQYTFLPPRSAGIPISEVMPRRLRISPEFGGDVVNGMLAGGLLSSQSVYLKYDTRESTPERAIWRDTGLPAGVGNWQLSVTFNGTRYEARLSLRVVSETYALPSQVMLSRHWKFADRNQLHGVFEIGNSKTSVTLIVEALDFQAD
jgi:hypothetical protein